MRLQRADQACTDSSVTPLQAMACKKSSKTVSSDGLHNALCNCCRCELDRWSHLRHYGPPQSCPCLHSQCGTRVSIVAGIRSSLLRVPDDKCHSTLWVHSRLGTGWCSRAEGKSRSLLNKPATASSPQRITGLTCITGQANSSTVSPDCPPPLWVLLQGVCTPDGRRGLLTALEESKAPQLSISYSCWQETPVYDMANACAPCCR